MKNIGYQLRKKYTLALSIIILLVLVSQCVIQLTIRHDLNYSRVINIAGRQRMLSQQITKDAFGILSSVDKAERARYRSEFEKALLLWEKSHQGLLHGDQSAGLPGSNSAKVKELFSKANPYFKQIAAASHRILADREWKKEILLSNLQTIKQNEPHFLILMNEIVFQYDTESKHSVRLIQGMELLLMAFTLLVLAMEARFIFWPAEKSIQKTFAEITERNENILKLFEIAPTALFLLVPPELTIVRMNSLAEAFVESSPEHTAGKSLLGYFKESLESQQDLLDKMVRGEHFSYEEATLSSLNHIKAVLVSSNTLLYKNTPSIIVSMMDISRQKHAESILKKYATVDELTGLLNRHSGKSIMDNVIERAYEEKRDLAVCFCDIDGLKAVNDAYGHQEGDWYIAAVAEAIQTNLREDDFAFRYGGDELVLLLNNCSQEKASMITKRINHSIDRKGKEHERPYLMSVSIGVANLLLRENATADDMIAQADILMYEEKKRKKAALRG